MKKENGENRNYVLDSSAFLALFEDEDGADTVQELLEKGVRGEIIVFASFVTFTEVFYITFRERGEEEAKKRIRLIHRLTITTVESSRAWFNSRQIKGNPQNLFRRHMDCRYSDFL